MKTVAGISHFFENNTPKFWQILGDASLFLATISTAIIGLPAIMAEAGIEGFVLPAFLLKIAKYAMAAGAVIKFLTKFVGTKEAPKV